MSLTKTRNDLVNQALRNLGILAAGQTADTEDFEAVDDHVDGTLAQLAVRDIVTIVDDDDIPIEWMEALSVVLADAAAIEFGQAGIPTSPEKPNPVGDAEALLREMNRGRPTGEPQRGEYF